VASGKFLLPWEETLKWWLEERRFLWQAPPQVFPCELRLTARKDSNGKILNVRCRCMAGTNCEPSRRYCNYDIIGEAGSLEEAKALWRRHTGSKSAEVAA
jgi:hypothetical protein